MAERSAVPGARVEGPVRFESLDPELAGPDGAATLVGTARPRLSWRIKSRVPGWSQQRAEVRAVDERGTVAVAGLAGADQVLMAWPFADLRSRQRVSVSVRVFGADRWSRWSRVSVVEAGLLEPADWTAAWITPVAGADLPDPAPVLERDVEVADGLLRARLYISALGIFVAMVNGTRVGNEHFAPGWTSYDREVGYRTYDLTALLRPGTNVMEALLGNGWYRGRIASFGLHRGRPYGERLALLAQLELTYRDGRRVVLGTDESWHTGPSRVLADDYYDGQTTDLTWPDRAGRSGAVERVSVGPPAVTAPVAPPVRELETLAAIKVWPAPAGGMLVDFGRNVVGWVRLSVRGSLGGQVTVRHAEVLEHGELSVRPLRSAQATDRYVLAGGATELLEPSLTFHGFRYAEITGITDLEPADVVAVVLGSDLHRTGTFVTSSKMLNRLHANVVTSMRGNFLDIPTDCPARDERLGWCGDTQVFAPTATALADVAGFLSSWLHTLAGDQLADGTVPVVVPRVFSTETPAAGWGDAAVIVPWVLYQRYGDTGVLERQYASMRAWVERVAELAGPALLWAGGPQLGDWLDPLAPPDAPSRARADPDVVATAHFARSTDLLARTAGVLGHLGDLQRYRELAERIRRAFTAAYVAPDGTIRSDCQTVYSLALHWDLLPYGDLRARAGRRLVELVRARGHTVTTGFLGTPVILDALTSVGAVADAYAMVNCRTFPSWLYAVDLGATSIWERWDSLRPDGSVHPDEMTSFNHYAFGAVADWMHRTIGGLAPTAPGYRQVRIAPVLGGGVTSAAVSHLSPYGRIAVSWRIRSGRFVMRLEIPVGVTATVALPDGTERAGVGHGRHELSCPVVRSSGSRTRPPGRLRQAVMTAPGDPAGPVASAPTTTPVNPPVTSVDR